MLHRTAGGGLGRQLRSERRGLAASLEAHLAGRCPGDNCTRGIGDRDDGVVERALDVSVAVGHILLFLTAHLLGAGSLGGHVYLLPLAFRGRMIG